MPTCWPTICTRSDTGLPFAISTTGKRSARRPASGIGSRLMMPRLMLTMARKLRKAVSPAAAVKPAAWAMLIGPLMFFTETWPMIIRPIIVTVSADMRQVSLTASPARRDRSAARSAPGPRARASPGARRRSARCARPGRRPRRRTAPGNGLAVPLDTQSTVSPGRSRT
jgi:hypothetical protein